MTATGGVTANIAFLLTPASDGLATDFATGLTATLAAALTGVLEVAFGDAWAATFGEVTFVEAAFTRAFTGALAGALSDALVDDLMGVLFGALVKVLVVLFTGAVLAMGLALPTGLTGFFVVDGAEALVGALEADLGFGPAAGLGAAFDGALATVLTTGLPGLVLTAFFAGTAGLMTFLIALTDFAGFAFTACLLWDAAAG